MRGALLLKHTSDDAELNSIHPPSFYCGLVRVRVGDAEAKHDLGFFKCVWVRGV